MGLVDMILPIISVWWKKRSLRNKYMKGFPGRAEDEKDRKLQLFIESQFVLEKDTNVLVMSYSDIFIQVGYVMLFA
jgi:hypothetical protein